MKNLKNNICDESNDEIINKLNQLPDISCYQDKPIKNRSNWFNKNLILFITIIGVLGAIIIILLIKLFA